MEPIIKIENLSVAYDLGKTNEFWALKDVSFEVYPEEYIIFFGPSGCGKSTLLYTIAGLEAPTTGKVTVNGKDLARLSEEEVTKFHLSSIGMIFQAYYLISNLSVKDNIMFPLYLSEEKTAEREKKAKLQMERFGLANFQKRRPIMMSGGQQQRVAIARALINDPPIILADEPVGNLDSNNAETVIQMLSDLNEKYKKTVIHVTHDSRYLSHANRIFYIKDGKIVRVVVNPEKKSPSGVQEMSKQKISELERLAQAYPYLTDTRLRAKLILNHLLFTYGIEEQQKIEETIDSYVLKKIADQQLFEILSAPPINMYVQTARTMAEKIVSLSNEMEMLGGEQKYPEATPAEERAMALRGYLLDNYKGQLGFEQIKRIEEFLSLRMLGRISAKELRESFDRPVKNGGVGLNRRTAVKFSREVELILMKK